MNLLSHDQIPHSIKYSTIPNDIDIIYFKTFYNNLHPKEKESLWFYDINNNIFNDNIFDNSIT